MSNAADPFDRAVKREQRIRERAAVLDSPSGFLSLAFRWFALMGVGWAAILAMHWALFGDPRWLAVLHTVVFAVMVGYWCIAAAFIAQMKKRRPDWFGDV